MAGKKDMTPIGKKDTMTTPISKREIEEMRREAEAITEGTSSPLGAPYYRCPTAKCCRHQDFYRVQSFCATLFHAAMILMRCVLRGTD
jgi:hypothetical protein